jgi:hypothetical protein
MKTTWRIPGMLLSASLICCLFYACSKDNSANNDAPPEGQQHISLYLTDDPGFFDKVMVDIKSVKVLVDTCAKRDRNGWWDNHRDSCFVWDSLTIRPGVYDLLTLRNGTDTLLAGGNIPSGRVKYIKIELGNNNSLVKDSTQYPLALFPGTDHFILVTLKGDEWDEYLPGRLQLWLDFDVTRSVIKVRDNLFYLKPFIKIFTERATGSIEGKVLPRDAFAVLTAYNGQDTAYALPDKGGQFKMRGLLAGTYTVFINGSNGYQDTTLTNVSISSKKEVKLGTITLHK